MNSGWEPSTSRCGLGESLLTDLLNLLNVFIVESEYCKVFLRERARNSPFFGNATQVLLPDLHIVLTSQYSVTVPSIELGATLMSTEGQYHSLVNTMNSKGRMLGFLTRLLNPKNLSNVYQAWVRTIIECSPLNGFDLIPLKIFLHNVGKNRPPGGSILHSNLSLPLTTCLHYIQLPRSITTCQGIFSSSSQTNGPHSYRVANAWEH